jgi:hypothetical protein
MGKPAAYTVQLTKKVSGALQMRLMIPGYEAIVMQPKELRDVAAGIEAMFAQAEDDGPAISQVEKLQCNVNTLSGRVKELERLLHTNLSANSSQLQEGQIIDAMSPQSGANGSTLVQGYAGGDSAVEKGAPQPM